MVGQEPQAEAVRLLELLRAMLCTMCTCRWLNALHALRRLHTIAFALNHHKKRFPDNVSTHNDVDIYNRASRAYFIIIIFLIKFFLLIIIHCLMFNMDFI